MMDFLRRFWFTNAPDTATLVLRPLGKSCNENCNRKNKSQSSRVAKKTR
jgi:hypothetical protein